MSDKIVEISAGGRQNCRRGFWFSQRFGAIVSRRFPPRRAMCRNAMSNAAQQRARQNCLVCLTAERTRARRHRTRQFKSRRCECSQLVDGHGWQRGSSEPSAARCDKPAQHDAEGSARCGAQRAVATQRERISARSIASSAWRLAEPRSRREPRRRNFGGRRASSHASNGVSWSPKARAERLGVAIAAPSAFARWPLRVVLSCAGISP